LTIIFGNSADKDFGKKKAMITASRNSRLIKLQRIKVTRDLKTHIQNVGMLLHPLSSHNSLRGTPGEKPDGSRAEGVSEGVTGA
jgi:hypothetical protein